ncbi:MAG: hypothetical protein GX811_10215 [Lentisphaerae bacterium]|nr:hypothetical protein [Lentisphaerota bacterium]
MVGGHFAAILVIMSLWCVVKRLEVGSRHRGGVFEVRMRFVKKPDRIDLIDLIDVIDELLQGTNEGYACTNRDENKAGNRS